MNELVSTSPRRSRSNGRDHARPSTEHDGGLPAVRHEGGDPRGDAQIIAATTAAAVREAFHSGAAYSDRATLNAELDFHHKDTAGNETSAKISIRFGK